LLAHSSKGVFAMYEHRPAASWSTRLLGSARTLTAIVLTALLASALMARWTDVSATGANAFVPSSNVAVAGIPVTIEGAIVGAGEGKVAVIERNSETPVAFPVADDATVMRDGQNVPLDALRVGDTVRVTIDGRSGTALRLHAAPATSPALGIHVTGTAALLAALGLIAGATALAILNPERVPALPSRALATRLVPVTAAR
jgi:hypothetical protein